MARYYQFISKDLPSTRNYYLLSDAEYAIKHWKPLQPRTVYQDLICPKCYQADHDKIFKRGFPFDLVIKWNDDLVTTCDGFLCLNEKAKSVLERHKIGGIKLKPLGQTRRYVACITLNVSADRSVYTAGKDFSGNTYCPACKRAVDEIGSFELERQLSLPRKKKTFFRPKFQRGGRHTTPGMFATEEIVRVFKQAGLKGGSFRRLFNADEESHLVTDPEIPVEAYTYVHL